MKKVAGLFAAGIMMISAPTLAAGLTPEQQTGFIQMAAQLTRAAEVCKHHTPAQLAVMRTKQRSEMIQTGIAPAKYDSVYAAQTIEASKRFKTLTPAQLKTTCDQLKNASAMQK